jgi:hypothetical protein
MPNPEAFWAKDPPPMTCLMDGSMGAPPVAPGGTPECPSDKNREGCGCDTVGASAACWPGLRVNRNRGTCKDGVAKCEDNGEFGGVWSKCEGYVPPTPGANSGPSACRCFSQGTWLLDNLSVCLPVFSDGRVYAISAFVGASGEAECGQVMDNVPPTVVPGTVWTKNHLNVDCEGKFELCMTLKAGAWDSPTVSDCVVARTCVTTWYATAGMVQDLPDLPSWVSGDPACGAKFSSSGGYGEMTVKGLSLECDAVDDGAGGEYVFNRVGYCPASCSMTPDAAECLNCSMSGGGNF